MYKNRETSKGPYDGPVLAQRISWTPRQRHKNRNIPHSSVPLGRQFLEFYSRAQDPARPALSHWSDSDWDIKVPYSNQKEEVYKLVEFQQLLSGNLSCNVTKKDRLSWKWDPKQVFFVKKCLLQVKR